MRNPLAFGSMPVTMVISAIYLALLIPLIVLHETVPKAPSIPDYKGTNITEAWLDLTVLSNGYHPFNSKRNDEVRNWLLLRIGEILDENQVDWATVTEHGTPKEGDLLRRRDGGADPAVTVFDDMVSNVTCSALGSIGAPGSRRSPGQSTYFEGTNIMVYIRGTEDEDGPWWNSEDLKAASRTHGKGGVLINAHYDSVSTGFGATDDGVGVVTVLQIIKYFTKDGNRPKKGIVALFNNGEEDFLNGARAYARHPVASFPYTFLNLEGAGAGGKATLFRSTDTEVTRAYAKSPHPFGTVLSADAFKSGFLRSQTDYIIFNDVLGLRGLDVSFWTPRARYHTNQDDAVHTSTNSIYHMLSAAISTMQVLSDDTSNTFLGSRGDNKKYLAKNGRGSDSVWFDLFGKAFAVFRLRALFAWSLTILIVSPLTLILITYLLLKQGKYYFFSRSTDGADVPVGLNGWRGFTRFPIASAIASAVTYGVLESTVHRNALIVYSSIYSVWAMAICSWTVVFWCIVALADHIRPSALHRGYSFIWLFAFGWTGLIAETVLEDRLKIAGGYFIVFLVAAIFFATVIALCELFALPRKSEYASWARNSLPPPGQSYHRPASASASASASATASASQPVLIRPGDRSGDGNESARSVGHDRTEVNDDGADEPSETTPLINTDGANDTRHDRRNFSFANYASRLASVDRTAEAEGFFDEKNKPQNGEQKWSGSLPSWAWIFQFLLLGPFSIILTAQIGLLVSSAVSQTGSDGSPVDAVYKIMLFFTLLVLLPASPFLHRISPRLILFLCLVCLGTFIYNMVAFPFSAENRYKVFFQQTIDLESGLNRVSLIGIEKYIRPIIHSIPSASGKSVDCGGSSVRTGLTSCSWEGIAPVVVANVPGGAPPETGYGDWLSYNVTRDPNNQNSARFHVKGANTRACVIRFDRPIRDFYVQGSVQDNDQFDVVPESGSSQIKLWHRDWDQEWVVDVAWYDDGGRGMEGSVVCLWSDANTEGVIPALDEVRRFMPVWSAATKAADGLVEGSKKFMV